MEREPDIYVPVYTTQDNETVTECFTGRNEAGQVTVSPVPILYRSSATARIRRARQGGVFHKGVPVKPNSLVRVYLKDRSDGHER